jgi:hypothetical protein
MSDSIHAAFAAAYQQIENVKKNATNPHFGNSYANLETVLEEIKPALEAQNLVLLQPPVSAEWGAGCRTIIRNEAGEELEFPDLLLPYQKRDPQGAGSCLSYARRYALKGVFSLAEVDDDGEQASKPEPAQKTSSANTQQQVETGWAAVVEKYKANGTADAVVKYLADHARYEGGVPTDKASAAAAKSAYNSLTAAKKAECALVAVTGGTV